MSSRPGVTLVTGGSGGIGAAIARKLAARGRPVAVTYFRNRDRALELTRDLESEGVEATALGLDLRDETATREAVDALAKDRGGIEALVTAHGPFIEMRHISNLNPRKLRDTFNDDTFSAYNVIHAAIPHLRKSRGALVAMVTAAIGRYASTDILSVAPKAAIEAIVRGVAVEEGRYGVRSNSIGVGLLGDGMFDALVEAGSFTDDFLEKSRSNIALRRMGSAEEIASVADFLLSDASSYITGQMIMVDGGYVV